MDKNILRNYEIFSLRENGATFSELAKKFSLSTNRVREIYMKYKRREERGIKNETSWLSVRVENMLRSTGLELEEALKLPYHELLKIRNLGVKTARSIIDHQNPEIKIGRAKEEIEISRQVSSIWENHYFSLKTKRMHTIHLWRTKQYKDLEA